MTTAHTRIFYENIYNFTDNDTTSNIMPLANLTVPWSEHYVTEKQDVNTLPSESQKEVLITQENVVEPPSNGCSETHEIEVRNLNRT